MDDIQVLKKYFPDLTGEQVERFAMLGSLYGEWNSMINVISRKDMDNFYEHHVLHSLAIAKVCEFDEGARVLDVGCGGGFPGIPLAIMFPETNFTLVDSIAKKIKVVNGVASSIGLENVTTFNGRVEAIEGRFDYVVSRAVTDMSTFVGWVWNKLQKGKRGTLPNGILYLKGGELAEELALARKKCDIYELSTLFPEEFFKTKKIIYIPKR